MNQSSIQVKICKNCSGKFVVTTEDLQLLEKISPTFAGEKYFLPSPTLCPDCRQQRRISHRNERKLYHRKCDLSGKEIISTYSPDKPYKVYDQEVWWSDAWDGTFYGKEVDFSRPFFEQLKELGLVVPRPCLVNMSSENSLYTNHSAYNKNCYMCINTGYSEDLLYCSNYNLYSQNCTDCLAIQKCERCYFCVNTKQCAFSAYLYECQNCTNCTFAYDCHACQDCFGCYNLRQKQYCIFNVQYTKEEYAKKLALLQPETALEFMAMFQRFWDMVSQKALHKNLFNSQCENSSGDHLFNNKNVRDSYYTFGSEDCAYCYDTGELKTSMDATEPFKGELHYETHGCNLGYGLVSCSKCYESSNLFYSQYCWYASDLFGCIGLKRKKYCILNKQYTKEEYEVLVPRIIKHMQTFDEWGEFFPIALSPFGYNETLAYEYFPLPKDQALRLGAFWKEDDLINRYEGPKVIVPGRIEEVSDEITKQILMCENCDKNYRVIAQELKFYRQEKLPIPLICPDCRHKVRMSLRNPRRMWKRDCKKCGVVVSTSFAPERPAPTLGGGSRLGGEIVYCESCYLKEVY